MHDCRCKLQLGLASTGYGPRTATHTIDRVSNGETRGTQEPTIGSTQLVYRSGVAMGRIGPGGSHGLLGDWPRPRRWHRW